MPGRDEKTDEVLADLKDLRNNVQAQTKNQIISRLAKLAAKMKMKGYDFVKSVFKVAKDEAIKYVIKQVLENGPEIIKGLLN